MELRKEMENNARAYNRNLTEKFLSKKSNQDLLAWVHPGVRFDFARALHRNGLLSDYELNNYRPYTSHFKTTEND